MLLVGVEAGEVEAELEKVGELVVAGGGDHGIFMETVRPGRGGILIHRSECEASQWVMPSGWVGVWRRGRRWLRASRVDEVNVAGGGPWTRRGEMDEITSSSRATSISVVDVGDGAKDAVG